MKRILFFLLVLCSMFASPLTVNAIENVELMAGIYEEDELGNEVPRGPIHVPSASIDDYTFYINESHPDYVLQLVDPDDETNVVYEISMPAGVNSVILPSSLNGEFIIQLIWGDWRFWGYIELE